MKIFVALVIAGMLLAIAGILTMNPPEPDILTQARSIQRANPNFHIWIELHDDGEAEIMGAPKKEVKE